jgi:cation:H+ antiporter
MTVEILLYLGLLLVSLATLLKASDWFVDAAERIGLSLGISPFIVGVTIIAFGTSLPELAASIAAVMVDESEIVIGNVVGSNISNVVLILGVVAVVAREIRLTFRIMDLDIPLLVASSFLLWFVVRDRHVSMLEAVLLLIGLAVFLINTLKDDSPKEETDDLTVTWRSYALMILGGALVYLGANFTIVTIQKLSTLAGISPEIIALTLVALGTSLPELVVSLNAAAKQKTGMAVGNILGSNVFNTFAVMGIPALFGDLEIPQNILDFSLPFMVAITLIFTVMCVTNKISRWEGAMLLLFYAFFIIETLKDAF